VSVGVLCASREELQAIFGIDLVEYEPLAFPSPRDRRRWTVDDSESLEALYLLGVGVDFIALALGHSRKTVFQWASASQLRRSAFVCKSISRRGDVKGGASGDP